jgi:hypothetical protein
MFAFDSVAVDVDAVASLPFDAQTTVDDWGSRVQPQPRIESLKLNDADKSLKVTIGGQPLSVGLTNGQVAGLELAAKTDRRWSVSAFGGVSTTPVSGKGVFGNIVYGGRIDTQPIPGGKIGVSARINNGQADADEADTDFSFDLGPHLTVSGQARYKACEWRRHRYSMRLRYRAFQLTPVFEYLYARDDTTRFTAQSQLFGFLASNDPVRITGADLAWKGYDDLNIGLRTRLYDYPSLKEGAFYYAGTVSLKAPAGGHLNLEIGRMEGHLDETRYTLVDADMVYPDFLGLKSAFFNVDARCVDYDRPVRGRRMALHTSWGVGFEFLDGHIETRLSGAYGRDPFLGDDVGAKLSIEFKP